MSSTQNEWWKRDLEYRCPSCQGMAIKTETGKQCLEMTAEQIRKELRSCSAEYAIYPWEKGDGCNVIYFPKQYEKYKKAKAKGGNDYSTSFLRCTACPTRTMFSKEHAPKLYWTVQTRHGEVWAYNRGHLADLRDYIKLEHRPQSHTKLPTWMVLAKNRNDLVKRIDHALVNGP